MAKANGVNDIGLAAALAAHDNKDDHETRN